MEVRNTLSYIVNQLRDNWNTRPRLRVGCVIILIWFAAIPFMRSVNHHFFIKWASIGVLSIGVGFGVSALADIIGEWQTTDWPDMDDNNEWPGRTPVKLTTPPEKLADVYEYSGPETLSRIEYEGKAISWGFSLGWIALSLIYGIILWRPAPSPFTLEGFAMLAFGGAVFGGMIVIHEGLHGLVARVYGADVGFGWSAFGPYTSFTNVVLTRRQSMMVHAAPLLVLTPISFAAALFANGLPVYIGIIVLLFNTICSSGDLYQIGYRSYCPPESRVYHAGDGSSHLYLPEDQSRRSLLSRLDTGITWVGALFTIPPLRSDET